MEWRGAGIVLSTRKHGENDAILEVLSEEHGRHLGLVRGGRSKRHRPALQPGNELALIWKARLADQLGQFQIEPLNLRTAHLMTSGMGLAAVNHLAFLVRLLPERQSHKRLFAALTVVLDHLESADAAGALIIRFELELLRDLGAGLDLTRCAATGTTEDLAYVSPKSARAVSREAGRPYHDRLLPLPGFLVDGQRQTGSELMWADITQGFQLTGYFLDRQLHERNIKDGNTRAMLLCALEKQFRADYPWNFIGPD